mmetsp:Transcript_160235/g.514091  ORF Transcript_160235/g.514091 Transcript_160235/m.514091 type:complete len:323 (-) Transcript_160235:933-1901(-)
MEAVRHDGESNRDVWVRELRLRTRSVLTHERNSQQLACLPTLGIPACLVVVVAGQKTIRHAVHLAQDVRDVVAEPINSQVDQLHAHVRNGAKLLGDVRRTLVHQERLEVRPAELHQSAGPFRFLKIQHCPIDQVREQTLHVECLRQDQDVGSSLHLQGIPSFLDGYTETAKDSFRIWVPVRGGMALDAAEKSIHQVKGQMVAQPLECLAVLASVGLGHVQRKLVTQRPIQLALERVEKQVHLVHEHDARVENLQDLVANQHLGGLPLLLLQGQCLGVRGAAAEHAAEHPAEACPLLLQAVLPGPARRIQFVEQLDLLQEHAL